MRFKDYIKYWEDAAVSNRAIHHLSDPKYIAFKRVNIDEVWQSIKLNMKGKVVILENPEIRTSDALSDNTRKLLSGAVLFIEEVQKDNFDDEVTKCDELEIIAQQFMAKLINDVKKFKQNKNHPYKLKGIDQNTLQLNKVGPVFGNWFGWRLTFVLNQSFENNLVLDNADWLNDTQFSIYN